MKLANVAQQVEPWLAAVFCAVLSTITIVSNLTLSVHNGTDVGGWAIVFLCFLPMCFIFAGIAFARMQGEIRDLKKQLSELQGKPVT